MNLDLCQNSYKSAIAGGTVAFFGLDGTFSMLPPGVHWILAGQAVDSYCKGKWQPDDAMTFGKNAAYGMMGGFLVRYLQSR